MSVGTPTSSAPVHFGKMGWRREEDEDEMGDSEERAGDPSEASRASSSSMYRIVPCVRRQLHRQQGRRKAYLEDLKLVQPAPSLLAPPLPTPLPRSLLFPLPLLPALRDHPLQFPQTIIDLLPPPPLDERVRDFAVRRTRGGRGEGEGRGLPWGEGLGGGARGAFACGAGGGLGGGEVGGRARKLGGGNGWRLEE